LKQENNMSAKRTSSIHIVAALAAAASLVACASPAARQEHDRHHAGQPANASTPASTGASAAHGGMMGRGMMGSQAGCAMMGGSTTACPGGMQHMDKEAMCAQYRSMRDAPNDEARQAMMDQHMRAMPPEMRGQHMEMMRQHCQ